jgi:hypothetical protein
MDILLTIYLRVVRVLAMARTGERAVRASSTSRPLGAEQPSDPGFRYDTAHRSVVSISADRLGPPGKPVRRTGRVGSEASLDAGEHGWHPGEQEVGMRTFETTITVDEAGVAHLDHPLIIPPGRHRAVLVVDEALEAAPESWSAFLDLTYGSLSESDLERQPQGDDEAREALG